MCFSFFINHQLKLVVNNKIENPNLFIGFELIDEFSYNYLFRVNSLIEKKTEQSSEITTNQRFMVRNP